MREIDIHFKFVIHDLPDFSEDILARQKDEILAFCARQVDLHHERERAKVAVEQSTTPLAE